VIVSRNNLASLLQRAGRPARALEHLDAALAQVRPDTDQHAKLLVNHSDCLRRLGRAAEALESARAARSAAEASAGPDSPLARACDERLADLLLDAGLAAEAEPFARRVLASLEADPEAAPPARATARLRLGVVLAALGREREARAELESGLAQALPESEWRSRAVSALAALDG
jgi:tetratricopeptide (TPR) repeat protein